jgi:uncharacterized repeat protein (TIGR01451 family)
MKLANKMNKCLVTALRVGMLVSLWFGVYDLKAATNTVTLTITRVKEVQCNEGAGEACPNDYYPKVDIDAQGLDDGKGRFCCGHGTDFQPKWVYSRQADISHNVVSIHVELWDQDDLSGDDQINITSLPNKSQDLTVNLGNCTWQGSGGLSGFINTQSSSTGNGKDSAQLYFMIATSAPGCVDSDGDGLLDVWETGGINGVNLSAMGADPKKVDLYLQLDYLVAANHSHQPLQGAIQLVVQAFANAPIANVDGSTGIQLHIDVGPIYGVGVITSVTGNDVRVKGTYGDYGGGGIAIPEAGNTIVDWDGAAGTPGTNFLTLKTMNPNRDNIFRYAIFVHQTNARLAVNDCTSGISKGIPGVNFMISLGGIGLRGTPPALAACWGVDINGNSVGSQAQQAGTLMHEFGHTLGLHHGGNDDINNKPNYLSVMSYKGFPSPGVVINEQFCNVPAIPAAGIPGGCDYSRVTLPPVAGLNENGLDECLGIDSGFLGLGPVDFNNNSRLEGASNCQVPNNVNATANINFDTSADANNNGIQDPGEPAILNTLNGFNDWASLVYNFRTVTDFTTAGTPTEQEPDPQSIDSAHSAANKMTQAKLTLTVMGPADATPGSAITYSIKLENRLEDGSRGPAVNMVAVSTGPDASAQTLNFGTVVLRAAVSKPASSVVPCSAKDGVMITDSVRARGTDLANNVIDLTSSSQTTVHAPALMLEKGATGAVNAGEAITYRIRYQNNGSGTALNVVVTDTVPKDVYYSLALDQGAGPKPLSVTLNGDGTRTLVWNVGTLPPHSRPDVIQFTARPTLLALDGTTFTNNVKVSFQAGALCPAEALAASATTRITVVELHEENEPHIYLHWKSHAHKEPAETLARIQATDQRFDGCAGVAADGALSQPEVKASFAFGNFLGYIFHVNRPSHLEHHLLALYFNLATRRLNAGSKIEHEHDTPPGLTNVRDAALNAQATLLIPYSEATEATYHSAKEVLEEINH